MSTETPVHGDAHSDGTQDTGNVWLAAFDPIRPVLEPDERVVWRAKGTGFEHRLPPALLYAALGVMGLVWAWPKMPAEQIRLVELQPMGGVLFLILMLLSSYVRGGFVKRRRQHYALTDRRLIIAHLGRDIDPISLGNLQRPIARIVVDRATSEGNVSILTEDRSARYTLYGIKKPLETASLIASTLAPEIEIKATAS